MSVHELPVRQRHSRDDPALIEQLRQEIHTAINAAIRRGWQPNVIGVLLGGDLSLVNRLKAPSPRQSRLSTLQMYKDRLYLLEIEPPMTRAKRFLQS